MYSFKYYIYRLRHKNDYSQFKYLERKNTVKYSYWKAKIDQTVAKHKKYELFINYGSFAVIALIYSWNMIDIEKITNKDITYSLEFSSYPKRIHIIFEC